MVLSLAKLVRLRVARTVLLRLFRLAAVKVAGCTVRDEAVYQRNFCLLHKTCGNSFMLTAYSCARNLKCIIVIGSYETETENYMACYLDDSRSCASLLIQLLQSSP